MTASLQVHWHEGLFLQPHHVQLLQRHVIEGFASERRFVLPYPYGVLEASLEGDAMERMIVQFDRLRVMMRSGLEVNLDNADIPALSIDEAFHASAEPFNIALAVPLYHQTRANTVTQNGHDRDGWRYNQLYRIAEIDRHDENTGQNPQRVQVRKINARLIVLRDAEGPPPDMEVMPLLRILHAESEQGSGLPRRDPSYVAPAMMLSGAPRLVELVRELANILETRRRELTEIVRRTGVTQETLQPNQVYQLLRLQTYNRYAAVLPTLLQSLHALTPLDLYLTLRGILSELAPLHPDRPKLWDVPGYHHDHLMRSFDELIKTIRILLQGPKPNLLRLSFANEGRRLWATLSEEHFRLANDYFLGIQTRQDRTQLAALVEDINRFKLMPKSEIESNRYGIKLEWEQVVPLELPTVQGLHYFRLNRGDSGLMWDMVRQQRTLGIRVPPEHENDDYFVNAAKAVHLYMTVPASETSS